MLFNSPVFLLMFLPLTIAGFYWCTRYRDSRIAILWLLAASLVFYAAWDWRYLALLGASIGVNYLFGQRLRRQPHRGLLAAGVGFNLALIAYYKYADFFLANLNTATGGSIPLLALALPLGISFFTFQQIAYLVDAHRGEVSDGGFARYALFVAFFPQLIAGPIVHHSDVMPQLKRIVRNYRVGSNVVAQGLFFLLVGLFKKVVIADSLAPWVDPVFAAAGDATFFEAWVGTLAYSLQLYFDFSAYSEMAIGLGLLFGIRLPINFNSPYQATTIADFWRRWHMTLGRFLRAYLYIPIGGNRRGLARTLAALTVTMLLGGLWHGAGWQFLAWGGLHGLFLATAYAWSLGKIRLPLPLSRGLTLLAVCWAWVLFRAANIDDATTLWATMLGMNGVELPVLFASVADFLPGVSSVASSHFTGIEFVAVVALFYWVLTQPNVAERAATIVPTRRWAGAVSAAAIAAMVYLGQPSAFLYFEF